MVPPAAQPDPAPSRDGAVDALRGLLVIAVVIGHFPRNLYGVHAYGSLPEWIYFIHVPLFMALSCLFVKPLQGPWVGRRALQLLLPYLVWAPLLTPGAWADPAGLPKRLIMGNWASLGSVLWFLPALLVLNLLVGAWAWGRTGEGGRHRAVRAGLVLAAAVVFLYADRIAPLHPRIPFGLDVAVFLLPFTLLLRALWARREALRRPGWAWTLAGAAALVAGALLVRAIEPLKTHSAYARRVDLAQFSVPETLAGYLGMTLMGTALLTLALRLPVPRVLAAVGRASLPIYLLHYPILAALTGTLRWSGASWVLLEVQSALLVLLCLALPMALASALGRVTGLRAIAGRIGLGAG